MITSGDSADRPNAFFAERMGAPRSTVGFKKNTNVGASEKNRLRMRLLQTADFE